MEKIKSLVGMVSKKKFFSACKCYENNKYGVDYVKPQLCIDEKIISYFATDAVQL